MNAPTRAVSAVADVILRAQQQGRRTPMGLAFAIDAARMVMSLETARRLAELETMERLLLGMLPRESQPEQGLPTELAAAAAEYGAWEQVAEVLGVRLPYVRPADEDPVAYAVTPEGVAAVESASVDDDPTVRRDVDKLRALLAPSGAEVFGKVTPVGGGGITRADDEPPAKLTIYRASHDSIVMGFYTTAAAAREHCEAYARREYIGTAELRLWWREDEDTVDQPDEGEAELVESTGPYYSRRSGYLVTPLTVAAAFDEEADE